jgi:hypothetical protein
MVTGELISGGLEKSGEKGSLLLGFVADFV